MELAFIATGIAKMLVSLGNIIENPNINLCY
jgi:hypothetical protein